MKYQKLVMRPLESIAIMTFLLLVLGCVGLNWVLNDQLSRASAGQAGAAETQDWGGWFESLAGLVGLGEETEAEAQLPEGAQDGAGLVLDAPGAGPVREVVNEDGQEHRLVARSQDGAVARFALEPGQSRYIARDAVISLEGGGAPAVLRGDSTARLRDGVLTVEVR